MAEQKGKIDFASGQKSGDEPLGGAIPQSVNVLVDGVGAIHIRPGIAVWDDFGQSPLYDDETSVDGIVVWNGYVVYVTSDRLIHAQIGPGNGVDLSDATAATQLDGDSRPVMIAAEGVGGTNDMAIMAGGGQLQVWEGPGAGLSRRIGGTVPDATHCVVLSLHLVVNPSSARGQIQWSEANAFETWIGEFAEISSSPDPVVALHTNTGELIIGGTESVEAWAPDPDENYKVVRPWSSGFGAPYSFASNDETFGFLDNRMRIQLSNGRAYKAISDRGITSDLQSFERTDDCWGFRAQVAGWNLLGWHFPTVGRTFVWDVDRESWSEWRGFAAGQWAPWVATSMAFWADEKLHLVGLPDGTIGTLDPDTLSDNGEPIVAEIYSGFTDHGVDNWKQHISTRLAFRRGLGAFGRSPGPNCQLFWRDDTGAWEDPVELELGNVDDPNPVIEVRSLGVYRTRQWRLRFSDNVPVAFVGAIETFEVLEQ
jgi:hypothetical protein